MSISGLNELKVWVKAKELVFFVYKKVLPLLPPDEKNNMSLQVRRSSLSISSNIAEGYGRYNYQDNVRFCYIARGSLEETISILTIANQVGYLPDIILKEAIAISDDVARMLNGYIAFLKKSKRGENNNFIKDSGVDYDVLD